MRALKLAFALVILALAGQAYAIRLPGDLNGDGQVNFADFVLFAEHFGRSDGETFDPGVPDTVTVRDTIEITYWDTITVTDTLYFQYAGTGTSQGSTPKPIPEIWIQESTWGGQNEDVLKAVCESVQSVFTEPLVYALDSDIVVQENTDGPKVLFDRTRKGEYRIWLDSGWNRWAQQIFQFAHEYGHLITNYYQVRYGANEWLDESLSSMASLYALRKLSEKWKIDPPQLYGWTSGFQNYVQHLLPYARDNIQGERMSNQAFLSWFRQNHQALRNNAYLRDKNDIIAHNLIDIFENFPEAWNALRYLGIPGPVSWDPNQNFDTYLRGWYLRTPARWQLYVAVIANRFGYFPARKPTLVSNEGIR